MRLDLHWNDNTYLAKSLVKRAVIQKVGSSIHSVAVVIKSTLLGFTLVTSANIFCNKTSKTEVLQMPSAIEVFQGDFEFFKIIKFFKIIEFFKRRIVLFTKKLNFSKCQNLLPKKLKL